MRDDFDRLMDNIGFSGGHPVVITDGNGDEHRFIASSRDDVEWLRVNLKSPTGYMAQSTPEESAR